MLGTRSSRRAIGAAVVAGATGMTMLAGLPASAATSTFGATADTYTKMDAPSSNYGDSARISVQADAGYVRHAFVRFTDVTVPPVKRSFLPSSS